MRPPLLRAPLLRAAAVVILLLGASLAFAFSTGPPASRTGALAIGGKNAEPACIVCHSGNAGIPPGLDDPSGSLHILGVPPVYAPGATYSISLELAHTWDTMPPDPIRWGFEIQAVSVVSGDSAGTWSPIASAPPDSFRLRNGAGVYLRRRYFEHTLPAVREGQLGGARWDFQWTAPSTDIGPVYFFAAGNSANGDGISVGSGDFIFTTLDSTFGPGIPVAVPSSPLTIRTALEAPYPNPMVKCTDLTFTLAKAGHVEIGIFDLQGRRVRSVLSADLAVGTYGNFWSGKRDDGAYAKNGLYFVRMSAPGLSQPITRKITLAR